jgi:hypothetical protein
MADINVLATKDYPLRMIERVMDYDWLFARLSPYYCHDNGQNRTGCAGKDSSHPASVWHSIA